MILDISSLEKLARERTPNDVANFMVRINLPQYSKMFRDSEISGELLLYIDRGLLSKLGIKSPLHQMRIMKLFCRELTGYTAKCPSDYMMRFLTQNNLEKYGPSLEENGIDGDMLLEVEDEWMKSILEEIGVNKFDYFKIRKRLKTFV